jgi:hypothetical protein
VPITLHSDLVRLAKLARVGQESLVSSVSQCCTGAGGSFDRFTSSLEDLVNAAAVNVSAIAATVAATADNSTLEAGSTAVSKLQGRLLNNGGIKDCVVRAQLGYASGIA